MCNDLERGGGGAEAGRRPHTTESFRFLQRNTLPHYVYY